MAIILQSSVGGFSVNFLRKLPALEQAMIAHGLEPSEFVISKDRASPSTFYVTGSFFFEYTVFVGDESFTVTQPNDMAFLDYFLQRCVAEDDAPQDSPALQPAEAAFTRPGPIRRFLHWMAQPI